CKKWLLKKPSAGFLLHKDCHGRQTNLRYPPSIDHLCATLEEIYGDTPFDLQSLPKPPVKEQTKPINIKLHTEQRAARRAGYNYLVNPSVCRLQPRLIPWRSFAGLKRKLRRYIICEIGGHFLNSGLILVSIIYTKPNENLQVIEQEEIKNMRKEMVPKAQLMPFFDRPFFPQR
ncbi:hypothetical protein BHM03_00005175, partial [Ensete ventricosum]